MVFQDFVDVEVIYLSYSSRKFTDIPKVKLLRRYTANLEDIKADCLKKRFQNDALGRFSCRQHLWYFNALQTQLSLANNKNLRITEWNIQFSDKRAFVTNGVFHREFSFIIGPKLEHWYFGSPRNKTVSYGTQSNIFCDSTKAVMKRFNERIRSQNHRLSVTKLYEYAKTKLRDKNCTREFVIICVAAHRLDLDKFDGVLKD